MYVRQLSLTDFRNYPQAELDLEPGITAIVGPNGHGKTNLVEAIGYLAALTSHRVATDAPLVRAGAERAIVRAGTVRAGRDLLLEVEIVPGKVNRARLNRSPVRPRELVGMLRTVLFAPEDLALVKGDPATRRRFLDDLLCLLAPRFVGVRADYERVLRQRTTLLRQAGPSRRAARARRAPSMADAAGASVDSSLDVWDVQLAGLGAQLLSARLFLVQRLAPPVRQAYQVVSAAAGQAVLGYRCSLPSLAEAVAVAVLGGDPVPTRPDLEQAMIADLAAGRTQDLDRGVTLVGPHRDDLVLQLGDLPAKGYASHGESWSFALALRLAGYDLLRHDQDGGDPVLILDDVFAELDAGRRARLADVVADAEQVLVTAAVEADIPDALAGRRVWVEDGQVRGG